MFALSGVGSHPFRPPDESIIRTIGKQAWHQDESRSGCAKKIIGTHLYPLEKE